MPFIFNDDLPHSFTLRDLTFGKGTDYPLDKNVDLFSAPDIRRVTTDIAGRHGVSSLGPDKYGSKSFKFSLLLMDAPVSRIEEMAHTVKAAFGPADDGPIEIQFTIAKRRYSAYGKPGRVEIPLNTLPSYALATCEFVLTDPLWYSAPSDEDRHVLPMGIQGNGFDSPFASPFGAGFALPGTALINNVGDAPTGAIFYLFSQGMNAQIVSIQGGAQITLPALDVPPGQWLVIDTKQRSAWMGLVPNDLSSGASVGTYIDWDASDWFLVPPGESRLEWIGVGEGAGVVDVRSAWYS